MSVEEIERNDILNEDSLDESGVTEEQRINAFMRLRTLELLDAMRGNNGEFYVYDT